jgi:hypothetical protein
MRFGANALNINSWNSGPIGIPYNVVDASQPGVNVSFDCTDEGGPGPYPVPPDALIVGGSQSAGDRHVLVLDRDSGQRLFYIRPSGPRRSIILSKKLFQIITPAIKYGNS